MRRAKTTEQSHHGNPGLAGCGDGIEYLDFVPEETLLAIVEADKDNFEIQYPVEYPVTGSLYRQGDGTFVDAKFPSSINGSVVDCPFLNDRWGTWRLPVGDGPVVSLDTVRAEKASSGVWFWRAFFRRIRGADCFEKVVNLW